MPRPQLDAFEHRILTCIDFRFLSSPLYEQASPLFPTLTQSGRRILSSKVHFSSLGSAVTGLHCIGPMNAGSVRFRIVWCFLSFSPFARYFSARRPGKARLTHPARISGAIQPTTFMPTAKTARKNAALMKPVQPDDTLAKIVGSKPLPRSEVTKKIWDYIKKNKLQDAKKKTLINADDALKAVFGGKKQVTMFEMTKHVSGHVK